MIESRCIPKGGINLKEKIHPKYYRTKVTCACGATHEIGSTVGPELRVDICSACHPFFTGKTKAEIKGGRVERFKARLAKAKPKKAKPKLKKKK